MAWLTEAALLGCGDARLGELDVGEENTTLLELALGVPREPATGLWRRMKEYAAGRGEASSSSLPPSLSLSLPPSLPPAVRPVNARHRVPLPENTENTRHATSLKKSGKIKLFYKQDSMDCSELCVLLCLLFRASSCLSNCWHLIIPGLNYLPHCS